MAAIMLMATLILGGAFVIFLRRGKLKYTNRWRAPRISIYLGVILVSIRWADAAGGGLVLILVLVLLVADITLGNEANKHFEDKVDLTLRQEVETAWGNFCTTIKYGARNLMMLLAPNGWGVKINYDNRIVEFILHVVDRGKKSTLFLFVIMYGSVTAVAILLILGFGILGLTWVASDESTNALILRRLGGGLLVIYGPFVAATWLVSCVLVGVFGMLIGWRRAAREGLRLFTYFAGATGVGAAVGLVSGVLSPAVWNLVKTWAVFDSMLTKNPAISGDLALTCSSLGIVFGALFGMYLSLRKYNRPISNLVYREVSTFGVIGISAWLVSLLEEVSPEEMLRLVLRESSDLNKRECAAYQDFEGLDMPDAAKCMNMSDPSFFGDATDIFMLIVWTVAILGVLALVVGFFGRLVRSDADADVNISKDG